LNDKKSFFAYFIGLAKDCPKTVADYNLSSLKGETDAERSIERLLKECEDIWMNAKF
jgi:hypothetical protein